MTSSRKPAEGDPIAAPPTPRDSRSELRTLIERAGEVHRQWEIVRVEAARLCEQSQAARARLDTTDSSTRLSALNLLEDIATARREQDSEAQQRRRAEARARESTDRYRLLFESMSEGFVVLERDDAFRIVECNPAFVRLAQHDNLLGRPIDDILSPGQEERFNRVLDSGQPTQFELWSPSQARWFNVSAARIHGDRPPRVALVVADITHRKAADEALRASQERTRLIVENAREYAILSTDLERRVTSWNTGAQAITGYAPQEVLGRSADLIFTPEDRAKGEPEREALTALNQARASDERWHLRKDGTRFWGSGVMTAMRDAAGNAIGLLKIFRDHTAELQAKQALEESRRRLVDALEEAERARGEAESANRAKDHFFAVLSHELRTPLTPIMFASELLALRDDLPADVQDAVAMIRRNTALEARFVDDLLEVTRAARGKLEIVREPMDVHAALAAALEVTRSDFEGKKQRLEVWMGAQRRGIDGDFTRLQQVFWNLLKNAAKFTPSGGSIAVDTRNEGDAIVVDVSDTGIGIEADALETVFDPFTQADSGIARQYGGLGLGLAIAKASVEAHGGTLRAESEGRGHGARFIVTLPLRT